jgi:hypothetical protein
MAAPLPALNSRDEYWRLRRLESAYDVGTARVCLTRSKSPPDGDASRSALEQDRSRSRFNLVLGQSLALDKGVQFIRQFASPSFTVIRGDLKRVKLPTDRDLVNCRSLLDLFSDPKTMVARLAEALLPGGWSFLEEFDDVTLAVSNGSSRFRRLHSIVLKAKQKVWESDGLPNHLGQKLPDWFVELGLSNIESDCSTRVRQTGTTGAASWTHTILGLRPQLLKVGVAKRDLDEYVALLATPGSTYLARLVVRTWSQTALQAGSIQNMPPRRANRLRQ